MKTVKITAAALVASLLVANAANAATAQGTANATVIGALTIAQAQPLNFGSFSSGSTAGTINHFGSTTGGVVYQGGANFAVFNVNGTPNTNFNISVAPTNVTLSSGANSMIANISANATQAATNGTGLGQVSVLGTLNVAANQPSGSYTGTYNVTVNY